MKFDISELNKYCVAGDTDSIFVKAEPLLIKKFGPNYQNILPQEEIIEEVKIISSNYEHKLNDFLTRKTKEILNVPKNRIEFKTETIIKSAYWSGKRRYAQYIINKEGISTEEFDIKGLDIMKSNFPNYFREFGEELIKKILFYTPKPEIDKFILDFKKSLNTTDWKKLLKPTGLKKLKEYIASPPRSGEIFSKLEKKCPVNTKAAIFVNDILKFKGLDKKYPTFQIGDKMYVAILKPNPYKIDVIGFNGYNDPPEIIEFIERYIDREGLFDSIIKNKLDNLYQDLGWGAVVLNQNINKFFKF
jgi:hypothetical protein